MATSMEELNAELIPHGPAGTYILSVLTEPVSLISVLSMEFTLDLILGCCVAPLFVGRARADLAISRFPAPCKESYVRVCFHVCRYALIRVGILVGV